MILLVLAAVLAVTEPQLPDPNLTPGAINPAATKEVVCVRGYTGEAGVRNVPESEKKAVFVEYHLNSNSDHFELDHLISLELGGSNDIHNLWAQSYTSKPYNAHMKDALEDRLHELVCSGKIDLSEAQREISTNWIAAYEKYVKNDSRNH